MSWLPIRLPGGEHKVAVITESDLCTLMMTSQKPETQVFKRGDWDHAAVHPQNRGAMRGRGGAPRRNFLHGLNIQEGEIRSIAEALDKKTHTLRMICGAAPQS